MITFKPLKKTDFELLATWLNMDFVTKWYAKRKFTYDDVERKYSQHITGNEPIDSYIIYFSQSPIGYIQTYAIEDYPDYANCVKVGLQTAGLDMFIGDRNYIHKGLGKDIIRQFLQEIVFKKHGIEQCIAGPEQDNRAAIRVYEKAGFRYIKTVQCKDEKEPEHVMIIDKPKDRVIFHFSQEKPKR